MKVADYGGVKLGLHLAKIAKGFGLSYLVGTLINGEVGQFKALWGRYLAPK